MSLLQAKIAEMIQQHSNLLQEKQEEYQKLMNKFKKMHQTKMGEMTESIKKSEQKVAELEKQRKADEELHAKNLEEKERQFEADKQTEMARVSKRMESKTQEMKKIVKELRTKLTEKENQVKELEDRLNIMQQENAAEKSANNAGTEQDFEVEKVINHHSYKRPFGMANDISLLKWRRLANLNRAVNLACLPGSGGSVQDGKMSWVTGK